MAMHRDAIHAGENVSSHRFARCDSEIAEISLRTAASTGDVIPNWREAAVRNLLPDHADKPTVIVLSSPASANQ